MLLNAVRPQGVHEFRSARSTREHELRVPSPFPQLLCAVHARLHSPAKKQNDSDLDLDVFLSSYVSCFPILLSFCLSLFLSASVYLSLYFSFYLPLHYLILSRCSFFLFLVLFFFLF